MAAGPDGAILQADIWFPSSSDLFLQTEKLSQNRSQGTLTSIIWNETWIKSCRKMQKNELTILQGGEQILIKNLAWDSLEKFAGCT